MVRKLWDICACGNGSLGLSIDIRYTHNMHAAEGIGTSKMDENIMMYGKRTNIYPAIYLYTYVYI